MSSTPTTIAISTEKGVCTVTLNRPDSLNAFNEKMGAELAAALRNAEKDAAVRCIVLTGAGRAFCSGQDLADVRARYDDPSANLDFAAHLRNKYNPIINKLRTIEKPVIAAVNGVAAGAGASFAFACDLRIAARSASFVMAFVHVGLVPDSGATLTLLQHVGLSKATEYCMLGEKLPAEEAARVGIVNRLVEDADLQTATAALAEKLAAMPTAGIGLTKRALNAAWTKTIDEQLDYEAFLQAAAGHTADHREGVTAFLEKRKPQFQGK